MNEAFEERAERKRLHREMNRLITSLPEEE